MIYLKEFDSSLLWFKKLMNEDEKTMSYNAGYNISFPGYNKLTGTISKSESEYKTWLKKWQGKKDRFVAAIIRESDNQPIGEVCLHPDDTPSGYNLGIVLIDKFRGKGYSKPAMKQLLEEIKRREIKKVNHTIPTNRTSAIKCDISCGFTIVGKTTSLKFNQLEEVTILEKKL